MMASSNNHQQSSSSAPFAFRHRSLNNIRQLESSSVDATWNGLSPQGQRSIAQAADITNRFQQLQVNSDINIAAASSLHATTLRNESLAEEELIERLKEIINEFMTRSGRHYSYNTTMRWTVDHGNEINYSVVILINQPSDLI
jgi:hypothetical protein